MIKQLSDLGKKLRNEQNGQRLIHNALKEEPISIDIVIDKDGSFIRFENYEKKLSTVEAINIKKGKARLLVDKAEEVLAYTGKESEEKVEKKHQLYINKINDYKDLPELEPILSFYFANKTNGKEKALESFDSMIGEKDRGGNIAFRLKADTEYRLHEYPNVCKAIIDNYEQAERVKTSVSKKLCSICGKNDYPVEDAPNAKIKNVPDGMSAGCSLVSYDKNAFESYGLKENENSWICSNCAATYVEGLNWLLTNGSHKTIVDKKGKESEVFIYSNRKKLGSDTAILFWTRENQNLCEIDILEQPDAAAIANLLDAPIGADTRQPRQINQELDVFYSCTISGAAARIAVRDWLELSLPQFHQNICQWFRDIVIEHYDFDSKNTVKHYSRLYDLAKACQNRKDEKLPTSARAANLLWKSALCNSTPPIWILSSVLKCIQRSGEDVTPVKASLIRLILNRNNKGGQMVQEKLDTDNASVSYNAGRIFRVLESIQTAALGKNINAGVRERFFSSASTTPASAFGRLLKNANNHLSKLKGEKPGLAVVLDKEITELMAKINNFPTIFSLEEQGQFAIGYYHQKNFHYNKPELKELSENEEAK